MSLVKLLIDKTITPDDLQVLSLLEQHQDRMDFILLSQYLNKLSRLKPITNEYAIKQILILYLSHREPEVLKNVITDYIDEMSAQIVPRFSKSKKLRGPLDTRSDRAIIHSQILDEPKVGCTGSRLKSPHLKRFKRKSKELQEIPAFVDLAMTNQVEHSESTLTLNVDVRE